MEEQVAGSMEIWSQVCPAVSPNVICASLQPCLRSEGDLQPLSFTDFLVLIGKP